MMTMKRRTQQTVIWACLAIMAWALSAPAVRGDDRGGGGLVLVGDGIEFQDALDTVLPGDEIRFTADLAGDFVATYQGGVHYTINGNGHGLDGSISFIGQELCSSTSEPDSVGIWSIDFTTNDDVTQAGWLGCIDLDGRHQLEVEQCTFESPDTWAFMTRDGAGTGYPAGSYVSFDSCTWNNVLHAAFISSHTAVFTSCEFQESGGWAIAAHESDITVSSCWFVDCYRALRLGANISGDFGGCDHEPCHAFIANTWECRSKFVGIDTYGTGTVNVEHTGEEPLQLEYDCDGVMGLGDLLAVIAGWGTDYGLDDLLNVIAHWGEEQNRS